MAIRSIETKIRKAVDSFAMLKNGDSVLVGFSGGKDSSVLLHALSSLAAEYGISVTAFHVNHNIRGEEADRDCLFCKEYCDSNQIPFAFKSVDAIGFSKEKGIGLEEGARILRYEAFAEFCDQNGINKIATAHTASDNLETVLFNLPRGTSATGLRGIPPVRDNVIRPLIYCTAEEILEYAHYYKLRYVTDSTNADTDYTRNRIRHKVVPELKAINPSVESAVSNMCDALRYDTDLLASSAEQEKSDNPADLAKKPRAITSRILLDAYNAFSPEGALGYVHLKEMTAFIQEYVQNGCREIKRLCLPSKTEMVITPDRVYFQKEHASREIEARPLLYGLNGITETGDALLITADETDVLAFISQNIYKISTHSILKKSALEGTIIRGRRDGDVFSFSNMTKKVKKMLNEAKLPIEQRNKLPLVCDSKGIVLIPGFPPRDDAKPDKSDQAVHIFYLTQEKMI